MTTWAQLRKAVGGLTDADESADSGSRRFTVRGEEFAAYAEDRSVELRVSADDAARIQRENPTAVPLVVRGREVGVRIPIADINGQALNHWVRAAWHAQAPQSLAAEDSGAATVTPGSVGDLPKSIGAPATRGLVGAKITSLALVAQHSDEQLLEIHGVGPKAVRLLREAIDGAGSR